MYWCEQILAVNADNAAANNTQTRKLASLDNSFDVVNHVRCFNHTLQLAAKALLKPFAAGLSSDEEADGPLPLLDDDIDLESSSAESDGVDVDDNVDELEMLPDIDRDLLISDTTAVKATIAKVGFILFCSVFCSMHHLGPGSCICSGPINHHLITCMAANLRWMWFAAQSHSSWC